MKVISLCISPKTLERYEDKFEEGTRSIEMRKKVEYLMNLFPEVKEMPQNKENDGKPMTCNFEKSHVNFLDKLVGGGFVLSRSEAYRFCDTFTYIVENLLKKEEAIN